MSRPQYWVTGHKFAGSRAITTVDHLIGSRVLNMTNCQLIH